MKPFNNLGMTTLTSQNTGGTDHLSFDAVGVPGFQFIQDPVEYDTRTHHSNMDIYERLQARRHDEERRHRRVVRLRDREPGREAAAQAAAQGAAAAAARSARAGRRPSKLTGGSTLTGGQRPLDG